MEQRDPKGRMMDQRDQRDQGLSSIHELSARHESTYNEVLDDWSDGEKVRLLRY
jgi:hypothetical protein